VGWRRWKMFQAAIDPWACKEDADGVEAVGGKDHRALDCASRCHVEKEVEDEPQTAGEVDAVAVLETGGGGRDIVAALVCGRRGEEIPHPRGKRHYQGRAVVGHMGARSEAPA
jgi:hypothetical protein